MNQSNPKNSKGEWKISKFWDTVSFDIGHYKQGWNYEVAYHTEEDVWDEEYFENRKEAEDYLEEKRGLK